MDINILIICITVIVGLVIVCSAAVSCAEKHMELNRPRSLAEAIGGMLPEGRGCADRHED